jgi:hypothetical protein
MQDSLAIGQLIRISRRGHDLAPGFERRFGCIATEAATASSNEPHFGHCSYSLSGDRLESHFY